MGPKPGGLESVACSRSCRRRLWRGIVGVGPLPDHNHVLIQRRKGFVGVGPLLLRAKIWWWRTLCLALSWPKLDGADRSDRSYTVGSANASSEISPYLSAASLDGAVLTPQPTSESKCRRRRALPEPVVPKLSLPLLCLKGEARNAAENLIFWRSTGSLQSR